MGQLEALLAVQALDSSMDTLRQERERLPERSALSNSVDEVARILEQAAALRTSIADLTAAEAATQAEAQETEARIAELENQMRGGNVYAARDLQAISHQVATLQEKVGHLDETQIGFLEERDRLDAEVQALAAKHRAAMAAGEQATQSIAVAEQQMDSRIATLDTERAPLAQSIDSALLTEYEQLRARLGGVGVAKLDGHRCGGCQLELSNGEIDELRKQPDGSAGHCEQCGRLLVIVD